MNLQAGKFDQRIRFERATTTRSDTGHKTMSWSTLAECWAEVHSQGGAEITEGQALIPTHSWSIRTRRRTDITEKDRIVYRNKVLYIKSVGSDSPRAAFTEFLCTEHP